MHYFSIETIKDAIERLQEVKPNWLLTSFVFAANGVNTAEIIEISEKHGTDRFLKKYFDAGRIGVEPFATGNNLMRPRMKNMPDWKRGPFAGDYIIRQDTKLWANILSSRGYREMRLSGLVDGDGALAKLTEDFQPRFEAEIPLAFQYEDFLVWLYAFEGFPTEINSWASLFDYHLADLDIAAFPVEYAGRFKLSNPPPIWPELLVERPSNEYYLHELAPALEDHLSGDGVVPPPTDMLPPIDEDDPIFAAVRAAISQGQSYSFLLAGPPGTGKTRHARQIASALTAEDPERVLFLQFHPALGYDDFIEGFRPKPSVDGKSIEYALERRLFMRFSERAERDISDAYYVVVIDELNRGDVARIFGEVLTYLEPDYRGNKFTLSFSGEEASIPRNVILIATANPFDRSVTDLDDALLRRFWVVEMQPNKALLEKHLRDEGVEASIVNRALRLFEIMNGELATGFGHTSLLKIKALEDLTAVWTGRLRLMLQRALIADRPRFEAVSGDIETLLSLNEAEGEVAAGEQA